VIFIQCFLSEHQYFVLPVILGSPSLHDKLAEVFVVRGNSKKIAVKVQTLITHKNILENKLAEVFVVRSKSKTTAMKVQILITHKNILENKIAKALFVRGKSDEIDVKKQNAGDADTHHPQEHPREQLSQGGHRERQVCADQRAPADRQ
jgi:hypothetical protein